MRCAKNRSWISLAFGVGICLATVSFDVLAAPSFVKVLDVSVSGRGRTASASLEFREAGKNLSITLFGVEVAGFKADQEFLTKVRKSDLQLQSSKVLQATTGKAVYTMTASSAACSMPVAGDQPCYVYKEELDTGEFITEPSFEYKPVDLLSLFVVAGEYWESNSKNPKNISLLIEKTFRHVVMQRTGDVIQIVNARDQTVGIELGYARQGEALYPKSIRIKDGTGVVELTARPQ